MNTIRTYDSATGDSQDYTLSRAAVPAKGPTMIDESLPAKFIPPALTPFLFAKQECDRMDEHEQCTRFHRSCVVGRSDDRCPHFEGAILPLADRKTDDPELQRRRQQARETYLSSIEERRLKAAKRADLSRLHPDDRREIEEHRIRRGIEFWTGATPEKVTDK